MNERTWWMIADCNRMKTSTLAVACLLMGLVAALGGSEDRFIKKYAMMKVSISTNSARNLQTTPLFSSRYTRAVLARKSCDRSAKKWRRPVWNVPLMKRLQPLLQLLHLRSLHLLKILHKPTPICLQLIPPTAEMLKGSTWTSCIKPSWPLDL